MPKKNTWNVTHKSNSIIIYNKVIDAREFDAAMANHLKCSVKDATKMRKAFFEVLFNYLIKGHKVRFIKIGSFVPRYISEAWNFKHTERFSSMFINMSFASGIKKVVYGSLMEYWQRIGLRKQVDEDWEMTKRLSGTYRTPRQ